MQLFPFDADATQRLQAMQGAGLTRCLCVLLLLVRRVETQTPGQNAPPEREAQKQLRESEA